MPRLGPVMAARTAMKKAAELQSNGDVAGAKAQERLAADYNRINAAMRTGNTADATRTLVGMAIARASEAAPSPKSKLSKE